MHINLYRVNGHLEKESKAMKYCIIILEYGIANFVCMHVVK